MTEESYQITTKAHYINLLLLRDELQHFDKLLGETILDSGSWLTKLRTTRSVFLTLNNVKDASNRIRIEGSNEFAVKTRNLKKSLLFANHFRNRGIGHLDDTLLKRAVQWSPQLFYEESKDSEDFKIIEAQRTIIESCINSFIDKEGKVKIFKTEIDLMYPPDAKLFFSYLSKLVNETLEWLSEAIGIIFTDIKHHSDAEIKELAAIAGQTNFNLKEESTFNYSSEECKIKFSNALKMMEELGADPSTLEFLRKEIEI